jgi:hypothetical protein
LDSYLFDKTYDKYIDSVNPQKEIGMYKLSILKLQNDKHGYFFTASEYEKIESKKNRASDHEIIDTLLFKFDKNNKVFYSQYKSLKGNYELEGNKSRFFKGDTYPVLKLKNEEYYYIDGHWYFYIRSRGNRLFETASPCN